jgi:hypothetical protein
MANLVDAINIQNIYIVNTTLYNNRIEGYVLIYAETNRWYKAFCMSGEIKAFKSYIEKEGRRCYVKKGCKYRFYVETTPQFIYRSSAASNWKFQAINKREAFSLLVGGE